MIGLISLGAKQMGARSAGNPHAACDVEGAGNVVRSGCLGLPARQSSTLPVRASGRNSPGLLGRRRYGRSGGGDGTAQCPAWLCFAFVLSTPEAGACRRPGEQRRHRPASNVLQRAEASALHHRSRSLHLNAEAHCTVSTCSLSLLVGAESDARWRRLPTCQGPRRGTSHSDQA
jgi:hypothetical protein